MVINERQYQVLYMVLGMGLTELSKISEDSEANKILYKEAQELCSDIVDMARNSELKRFTIHSVAGSVKGAKNGMNKKKNK